MHNTALRAAGLADEYSYGLMYVTPQSLEQFLQWMRERKEVVGLSVTIPLKERILEHLDEIAECAAAIGSVNTVVKTGGKLFGYNTDYIGIVEPIKNRLERFELTAQSRPINQLKGIILGMGGAGKAALYALKSLGLEEIVVGVRTPEKLNIPEPVIPFNEACLLAESSDIVINATSIGDKELFCTSQFEGIYLDMVYTPLFTPTIKAVMLRLEEGENLSNIKESGLYEIYRDGKSINGLEMLVAQGVRQFELFTGHSPDVEVMTACLVSGTK